VNNLGLLCRRAAGAPCQETLPCGGRGRGRTCCSTPSRWTCWPVRDVAASRARADCSREGGISLGRGVVRTEPMHADVAPRRPPLLRGGGGSRGARARVRTADGCALRWGG